MSEPSDADSVWEELGRPDDWNPKVERALELIGAIYEYEPVGGPMHVELDDWNIEGVITPYPYTPASFVEEDEAEQVRAAVAELIPLLNAMTVHERASALARHWGYLPKRPSEETP